MPLPRPLLQWRGDTPPHTPPHWRLRRLEPRVFGSGPLHKILNTPLSTTMVYIDWIQPAATTTGEWSYDVLAQ